jgi:hypothetical protein
MVKELPQGFTHKYLCRGCVQRDGVKIDSGVFIVSCCGVDMPAILRAECSSFGECTHHKTNVTNLGRPALSQEDLMAVNAYAISLGSIDAFQKISMVAEFEAQLIAKA